jgi:hypothetical protein
MYIYINKHSIYHTLCINNYILYYTQIYIYRDIL